MLATVPTKCTTQPCGAEVERGDTSAARPPNMRNVHNVRFVAHGCARPVIRNVDIVKVMKALNSLNRPKEQGARVRIRVTTLEIANHRNWVGRPSRRRHLVALEMATYAGHPAYRLRCRDWSFRKSGRPVARADGKYVRVGPRFWDALWDKHPGLLLASYVTH
jgi:hypothetical protein